MENITLLTIKQVATQLQVKRSTIYDWIYKDRIPFIKLSSKTIRIRAEVVENMIKNSEFTHASTNNS